jgi:transcriptional regulator with XRE-family HTH domain
MPASAETAFGDRVREARLRLGLKQADVAERIDMSNEVYGRIERGMVVPRITTLLRICEVLHVEPNTLLLDERSPAYRNDGGTPALRQLSAVLEGADEVTIKRVAEVARWLRSPRSFSPASRGGPRRPRKR